MDSDNLSIISASSDSQPILSNYNLASEGSSTTKANIGYPSVLPRFTPSSVVSVVEQEPLAAENKSKSIHANPPLYTVWMREEQIQALSQRGILKSIKSWGVAVYALESNIDRDLSGDHILVDDRSRFGNDRADEFTLKTKAVQIQVSGGEVKVFRCNTTLDTYLSPEDWMSNWRQITDLALEFADWSKGLSDGLEFEQASKLAKLAMSHFKDKEALDFELHRLGGRVPRMNSYNWNKHIDSVRKSLEKQFKGKVESSSRKRLEPANKDDGEAREARSKNKQLLNLLECQWGDLLKFNEMTLNVEMDSEEMQTSDAYIRVAEEFDIDVNKDISRDIVVKLAKRDKYLPLRDYFDSLRENHSDVDVSVLDDLSRQYLGAEEYICSTYLKKTLLSLVARTYEPGCQHDSVCVLQGAQGKGKSRFWQNLLPNPDWFDDTIASGGNDKDERLKLRRFSILEFSEINAVFKLKETESLRSFITCRRDNLRVPYGSHMESFPRTSILVGTVNPAEFLVDPEGHRRYWVIPVKINKIPIYKLIANRDRIWAAAVKLYFECKGQEYLNWLTPEEEILSAQHNKRHESPDTWADHIGAYLEGRDKTTVASVLQNALDVDKRHQDAISQRRVSNCLKRMGWERSDKQQRFEGKVTYIWQPIVTPEGQHRSTLGQQDRSTPLNPLPDSDSGNMLTLLTLKQEKVATDYTTPPIEVESVEMTTPLGGVGVGIPALLHVNEVNKVNTSPESFTPQGFDGVDLDVDLEPSEKPTEYKVGDLVEWDSCPGHSEWMSPFTVSELHGDKVRLAEISPLVQMSEIRKV